MMYSRQLLAVLGLALAAGKSLRHKSEDSVIAFDEDADGVSRAFTVELNNFGNVQYYGPFAIGGQTFQVIYDTGSFEILVLSKLCSRCIDGLKMYDSSLSNSFESSRLHAHHNFAGGGAETQEGFEKMAFGSANGPFSVKHMPFWQITGHHFKFWMHRRTSRFSGIVGMPHNDHVPSGFGGDSSHDKTLLSQMGIKSFAMCLRRGRPGAPGLLQMGPELESMGRRATAGTGAVDGSWQSARVMGNIHWATKMVKIAADGAPSSGLCEPSCGAIVDSGTSLISAPPSARKLVQHLRKLVKPDCSNFKELPSLTFELDGVTIALPPVSYVLRVGPRQECKAYFMELDKRSELGDIWILGMPFLRFYYTIFDRENKQMRIAPATPDCQIQSVSESASFMNSTVDFVAARSGTRTFAESDFMPMEADETAIQRPLWEKAVTTQFIQL